VLSLRRNPQTRIQLETLLKSQPALLYDVMIRLFDEQEDHQKLLKLTSFPQILTNQIPQTPDSSQSHEKGEPEFIDLRDIKESPGPAAQKIDTIETVIKRARGRPKRNTTSPSDLRILRHASNVAIRDVVSKKVRFDMPTRNKNTQDGNISPFSNV